MSEEKIQMRRHDPYGDLMSLEEFIDCCQTGCFIDYDGHGYYATATHESDIEVVPSDIVKGNILTKFSHVKWYNR